MGLTIQMSDRTVSYEWDKAAGLVVAGPCFGLLICIRAASCPVRGLVSGIGAG